MLCDKILILWKNAMALALSNSLNNANFARKEPVVSKSKNDSSPLEIDCFRVITFVVLVSLLPNTVGAINLTLPVSPKALYFGAACPDTVKLQYPDNVSSFCASEGGDCSKGGRDQQCYMYCTGGIGVFDDRGIYPINDTLLRAQIAVTWYYVDYRNPQTCGIIVKRSKGDCPDEDWNACAKRFNNKCVGCCGGPDASDKAGPARMSELAKSLVFQDLGPQCCKEASSKSVDPSGEDGPPPPTPCDLQDGEPVGANSGNLTDYRIDLTIPATLPFGITPYYNSDNPYMGHLGYGWSSILSVRLFHWPDSTWSLRDPWGRRENFDASGKHDSTGGQFYGDSLHIEGDSVVLRVDEKTTWVFDRVDGTLREVHNDAGHGYRLLYDVSADPHSQPVAGTTRRKYPIKGISKYAIPRGMRSTIAMDFRVVALEDKTNSSHRIQISYDTSGMVSTATDHVGRSVGYTYDLAGNLSQVRHVDSTYQRWRFEDSTDAHRISAFDPLPLGAEDTLDPARMLKNKWDRLGRIYYQGMSRGDTKQEHTFERNPYSTFCTENSGATGSWTKRCTHVRSTTVNRTDANGLGGARHSSRTYLDSVVNNIPMDKQKQTGPAKFLERHITLTETVNGDVIRLKLIFDDRNNVEKVIRPDGTEMFLYGTPEGAAVREVVQAVVQQPLEGRGPRRSDGNAFSFSYSGSITSGVTEADKWSFQTGSPFTYRTEKLRSFKGEVNGTTYQYGTDTATNRKSFDAKGRLDSLYGFHGFEAKAWYAADTSVLPDSFTYADGTGLRIWRDGLGQITATRDALGRTSHFRYTAKGDVKLACGPDSLCVWSTWKNRAIVGTQVGMRLRPDGTMTPPLVSYAYRVNDQKRRTHTFRVVGSDSILIEKRLLDVWGNLAKRWVNPDTANTDSLQWQEVETNTYDARNRRTFHASMVNGQWQTVGYKYDVLGNLTKLTDARGVWTHVKMDAYGNVMSRRDTLGHTWSATYNERGLPLTETDPLGRVVRHDWNHLGNEFRRIGWRQDTTHWVWKHDRLLKHRTPEGRWTVFGYDTLSRLVRAVSKVGDSALAPDGDDLVTSWTYDKVGNRVTETVAGRKTHGWKVDGAGNVLADTNALGQVTRYVYDDLGQVTAVAGPTGDTLSVAYDGRGNLASLSVGRDTLVQSRWDNLSRPLQSRRPGQGTITRTFDAIGYLQSVKDSSGLASTFTADPVGADAQAKEGAKPARRIVPDLVGRVVSEWDETGLGTFTVWDSVDRVKEIRSGTTSPGNLLVSYLYGDSAGGSSRTTTWANGKTEAHSWDRDGLLRRFTDGRGITASYTYDSLARMTGIAYTKANGSVAGPSKRFRYSPEGWLLAMEHGAVIDSFARDGLGRVVKSWQVVAGTTRSLEHHRDEVARLDTLVYPDGKLVVRRMDTRGNLVSVWREGVRLDTLAYANGLRRSAQLGNGISTAYEYDANGRVTQQTNRRGTDLVTGYEFGYTPEGNLANQKRLHELGQSEVYHYTTDDQLDRAQRGVIAANGQILNPSHDWNWSIFEGDGKWFQYSDPTGSHTRYHNGDEVSNLTGDQPMVFAWDSAGNMTRRGSDTLFWTADGRLDSVGGKAKMVYDALGRLVQWRPVGGEAVTTTWDGWQEVFESSDSRTRSFIAGNGIDEKVAIVTRVAGIETTTYPLVGNNGNVEAVTDGAGNLVRAFVVDPYGTFSVTTAPGADGVWFTTDDVVGDASALDGEFVFQGRPWYGSLGLYTFRTRWMDPKQGIFISRDPLGPESDLNGYRFERNNPLGGSDPMGEDWGDFVDGMYDGASGVGYGLAIAGGVMLAGALAPELAVLAGAAAVAMNAYGLYGLADEAVGLATGLDADGNPICNRLGRAHRLAGNLLVGVMAGKIGKRIGKAARAKLGAKLNAEPGKSGSRSGRGAEPQGNLGPRSGHSEPSQGSSPSPASKPVCTGGSCSGDQCFVAGTLVSVKDSVRPIESVSQGDIVSAVDPSNGRLVHARVARTFVRMATSFVIVFAGGDSIASTSEHPYMRPTGVWVEAKDLRGGDSLWLPQDQHALVVDSIRNYDALPTPVYNFEVEGVHTYLVGRLGIAVHNACTQPGVGGAFSSGKPQHIAEVSVSRNGEIVAQSTLKSGSMTPDEAALGFPRSSLATHTEARAVKGAELKPGDIMTINGQYPPCPSCKGAMNNAVKETGATIIYNWGENTWKAGGKK